MNNSEKKPNSKTLIRKRLRWIARVWDFHSIGFILMFTIGEMFGIEGKLPLPSEWIGLLFYPFGLLAGLIIALWLEGLGGCIILLSIVSFYVWNFIYSGSLPGGPFLAILAAPGLLFLIYHFYFKDSGMKSI